MYAEEMLDPRWQKRRLEIMERDNWTCKGCESKEKTLTVHHIEYKGKVWETPDEFLQTLCVDCHKALGPHPKGGVSWEGRDFCYFHCQVCGAKDYRDKGSWDKCNICSHRIVPDDIPS